MKQELDTTENGQKKLKWSEKLRMDLVILEMALCLTWDRHI